MKFKDAQAIIADRFGDKFKPNVRRRKPPRVEPQVARKVAPEAGDDDPDEEDVSDKNAGELLDLVKSRRSRKRFHGTGNRLWRVVMFFAVRWRSAVAGVGIFAAGFGLWVGVLEDRLYGHAMTAAEGFVSAVTSVVPEVGARIPDLVEDRDPAVDGLPNTPGDWRRAKQIAHEQIYNDARITAYCGCAYDENKRVDLESCQYRVDDRHEDRAHRVEWEHIFPAYNIGHQRQCWQNPPETRSGRQHCEETDPVYQVAATDLHNVLPAIGQINALRSNYRYAEISGEFRKFGPLCDFELMGRSVEPRDAIKGAVARVWFYMRDTYNIALSSRDARLLAAWNNRFPPAEWELERDRRIAEVQGNTNPYVSNYRQM